MTQKIVIIAGDGRLPNILINEMIKLNISIHVILISSNKFKESLLKYPHTIISYGKIMTKLLELKKTGFSKIIFAGSLQKPCLKSLKPDFNMLKILPRLSKVFLKGGDDRLLSFLIKELELLKFEVLDIKNFLSEHFPSFGNFTKIQPSKISLSDIKKGKNILDRLAPMDVGQSVIIQEGEVLGIEAIEGTDSLITRTKKFKKNGEKPTLIKLVKRGQNLKADLPTIGLNTIRLCIQNSIGGIAFSGNQTLFIDYKKIISKLSTSKFFLYGIE